ncbi:peptidoglycan editing factor PgeF [Desulfatirhabdium butyrativorans]|uniref:peptidoglycan editing factor PgeF n=1 Tax=Desulfatirhabdium butyrativorans TaxID=340467 RepID=UPI0004019610|nr:peptidoglycan editing factor PgeF [Desulfatirhabdium butyrativorans]
MRCGTILLKAGHPAFLWNHPYRSRNHVHDYNHSKRYPLPAVSAVGHAVFTREGGVSEPPYDRLNVAMHNGDIPHFVAENRRRIRKALDGAALIFCSQVHGTDVRVISGGQGELPDETAIRADALITDIPGAALMIQVADCQSILLCDPGKRVIANVHSGWRGSIGDIAGKTVRIMKETFGCRGEDILAGIAPSLGPCCAEFVHYRSEIPEAFWEYRVDETHFDFWRMTENQLQAEGLLAAHIETSGLCTRCRTDMFFSYRRQRVTGRFAAAIVLKG